MNEETSSDKSPRSPSYTLEDSLEQVKKLHARIGKGIVKPEGAAIALGYKGVNGAALTTLGTLAQYGLIERSKGTVRVTPLAVRLLHPTSDAQFQNALREAALTPKVFQEIHATLGECAPDVLASHLAQGRFTPERAKRTASVFVANKTFAKLEEIRNDAHGETSGSGTTEPKNGDSQANGGESGAESHAKHESEAKVLAQYSIPLGSNEATIIFKGESLSAADFDALSDFVDFCKKQFQRKSKTIPDTATTPAASGPENSE